MCTPCFLGPTRVHIPNGSSIGLAVFAQLTAESPYTLQRATPFLLKTAPSRMGSEPHLTHGSLGSPESTTQTEYRSVPPFFHGSRS